MIMRGTNLEKTVRTLGLIFLMFLLAGTVAFALQEEDMPDEDTGQDVGATQGEEKISTLSDYLYKKDLQQYEKIKAVADGQAKLDQLTALLKERPISRILLYAVTDYMVSANKVAANNQDKLISLAQALWNLLPTDAQIQAEAKDIPVGLDEFKRDHLMPARQLVQRTLAAAYYQKKDFAKAAECAEKAYAIKADKDMLQMLFGLYTQMGNDDKIVAYGEKMLQAFPMKQKEGYSTALQLASIYLKKQNIKAATQLYSKLMDAYGSSVPPGVEESNWNPTRADAYTLMAQEAYTQKNYTKAEQFYQKVLTFDSRRENAYYYLGMCRWQLKDQKGAIVYFARCMVLNKSLAPKAKGYLEQLFKAEYPNGKEEDLNQIIEQAKRDLRLG
jgi:tetratricopeptide (TPR) repeat protein